MELTDRQRGLLMFFKNRQLVDMPDFFFPQPIEALERAIREGTELAALPLRPALEREGLLEFWET